MALGEATALHQLVGEVEVGAVTSEMVEQAAKNGDLLSRRILSEVGEHLGVAVLNLVHIFNPGLVIIGGGVSRIGELIFDPIRRVVMERAMPDFTKELRIVPADLSDDVALYGAVALVLQELSGV
jgi:predicted NBD/HSP70 family sugar kinase